MNSYAMFHRERKAQAIAAVLIEYGHGASDFPLSEAEWKAAAAKAGVNPPNSEETKTLVRQLVREAQANKEPSRG